MLYVIYCLVKCLAVDVAYFNLTPKHIFLIIFEYLCGRDEMITGKGVIAKSLRSILKRKEKDLCVRERKGTVVQTGSKEIIGIRLL